MRRSACVVALFVAGVLAGCGSSSSSSASSSSRSGNGSPKAPSGGGSFTVSESEFKITPKDDSVGATGAIAITVHNTGKIIHALAVQTPSGVVKTAPIQPGSSATLTVNLAKAGSYKLYCPIDGHAKLGMVGTLTVGGASAGGGAASSTTSTSTAHSSGY